MLKQFYFTFILFSLCVISCTESNSVFEVETMNFEYLSSEITGIDFVNEIAENADRNIGMYDYFYNGAGLACGDFDNDGLTDVFFCSNDGANKIYKNTGDLTFQDVSASAGLKNNKWSTGATVIDINKDGLLDIYVCHSGPTNDSELFKNELYINKGNFRFEEQAAAYGIADDSRSIQAAFFDIDNDGDEDLWVMNHALRSHGRSPKSWFDNRQKLSETDRIKEANTLYENRNGKFVDISAKANIQIPGFGLGINVIDINKDGFLDVFIANDYFIPDFLYINNGDKSFTNKIKDYFNHCSYYSMGSDAADINNDGKLDLIVADMTPSDHVRSKTLMASMNTSRFDMLTKDLDYIPQYMFNGLYLNHDNRAMRDIAHFSKVATTDWSWAPLLADFDNDGLKDLYITNGFYRDTRDNDWINNLSEYQRSTGDYSNEGYFTQLKKANQQPISNLLFKNIDGLQFNDVTDVSGLGKPAYSNGAAYADFDNDGDLDIIVNNLQSEAFFLKNNADQSSNHFVQFEFDSNLIQENGQLRICLYYNKTQQCKDYQFVRGYMSHVQSRLHFGLGNVQKLDSIVVYNQNGLSYQFENLTINQMHKIEAISKWNKKHAEDSRISISNISNVLAANPIKHQENSFNEYEKEVLLPHSQARLGPAISVADVNGDGTDDFFVGGAMGQSGKLMLQSNGSFIQAPISFERDAGFEDVGSAFFDLDNDGDLDLYVASGGGADVASNPELRQDRLYVNDGNGQFIKDPSRLPSINSSTKSIVSFDWDQDGDLDLFVAGRTSPGNYPTAPQSYFLENEGGSFTDKSEIIGPDVLKLGMITDAVAVEVLPNNKVEEIVLCGEWMPITVLQYIDGVWSVVNLESLVNTGGWWQSLTATDYDNDGDDDLLAGNIGLNNKFHPTLEKPLQLFANDFDVNGSMDIVLSKEYKGALVPVRGKECSSEQMPFISEKYSSYESFANADLINILGQDMIYKSLNFKAKMFESVLLINESGSFRMQNLPSEAQLSPIMDADVIDINKDGRDDLVIGGNLFDTEVETTPYDAGIIGILLNDYPSGFRAEPDLNHDNYSHKNNTKYIEKIALNNSEKSVILTTNNNQTLHFYHISN